MDMDTTWLTDTVARHWPLEGVRPGAILQRSSTRTVMALHSSHGSFVVKAYEGDWTLGLVRISTDELDRRLSIFDHLASIGFAHAPTLVRTQRGDRFMRVDGWTLVVLELIEGATPPSMPATWAALGHLAADLNAHTDAPCTYGIPVAGAIEELTRQADDYPFGDELLDIVATFDVLIDQPTCFIHGEINPANAIQSPEGRVSLLDWDQAGRGPWPLEPGYPLITAFLSIDLVFDRAAARAFYGAWGAGRTLTPGDRDLIFTAALLHALRYLPFADTDRRWARVRYALDHRAELLTALG